MRSIPDRPFELVPAAAFAPTARRSVLLFGAPVELCWLPERRTRAGKPGPARPPFPPCRAARIVAEEAVWRGGGLALTPNRHPFASRQLLLWSEAERREPDRPFLEVGFALAEAGGGALLVNSIGAAASIAWVHAHLIGERQPFLPGLPSAPAHLEVLDGIQGVEVRRAGAPFPATLIEVRGPVEARAAAVERLVRLRSCTAFGIVDQGGSAWVYPRGAEAAPPWFPQALGSAELWGRWCFDEREAFARATPDDLGRALGAAGLG